MPRISYLHGVAGAAQATGPTIVIDTFRAFTTAAVLLDRGVESVLLVDSIDEARALARRKDALLCGEVGGARPDDFDLGNSPWEAVQAPDVAGRVVVQRSSNGTRSVVAALTAGGDPVFAASLVVAYATANAVHDQRAVAIVSAGQEEVGRAAEDDLTAAHIAALLRGERPADTAALIAATPRAREIETASWAHPEDVRIATDLDRFAFAMLAKSGPDDTIHLLPVDD